MKVYVVYEYAVIEYEERFRIMSVHSSEANAKKAIIGYEEVAKQWKKCRAEYSYEEYALDGNYYYDITEAGEKEKMSKATICDKCKRILVCNPSAKIEVDFHYNGTMKYELCEECKQKLLSWLNAR